MLQHGVELMREMVREWMEKGDVDKEFMPALKNIFAPTVRYQHTSLCFHSPSPAVIIHGEDGNYKSVFFKRCNGQHINALGEILKEDRPMGGLPRKEMLQYDTRVGAGLTTVKWLAQKSWKSSSVHRWYNGDKPRNPRVD